MGARKQWQQAIAVTGYRPLRWNTNRKRGRRARGAGEKGWWRTPLAGVTPSSRRDADGPCMDLMATARRFPIFRHRSSHLTLMMTVSFSPAVIWPATVALNRGNTSLRLRPGGKRLFCSWVSAAELITLNWKRRL